MEGSSRTMNVVFRDYTPADRGGCIDVFESNIPEFFDDTEREYFIEFLGRVPGRYGVVVDVNDDIVGCGGVAASRTDPMGVDLTWGMVHRAHHRRGFGRILTSERLSWVEQMPNVKVAYLNTSHLTEAFYEKFGFRTVKRIVDGYRPGLHRCDMQLLWSAPNGR